MLPLCMSKSEPARGRDLSVESDRGVYANTKFTKKRTERRCQILDIKKDGDMEEDVELTMRIRRRGQVDYMVFPFSIVLDR